MISAGIIYLLLAKAFGWRLERLPHDWLETKLSEKRNKWGTTRFCLILGIAFLGCALLYVRLDTNCYGLGAWYAKLAANPFDFVTPNDVGFRRLTPLLSFLLGLRGELIIVTNVLLAGALLFCVAKYFVERAQRLSDTFFAVAAITFSLVTLTTIHCGGYADSATYLLLFLMWWFRKKVLLFYLFFFLGLLNRESVLFLVPWFVLLRFQEKKSLSVLFEIVVGFGISMAGYYFYREWIASHAAIKYSWYYYSTPFFKDPLKMFWQTFPYHGLGAFSVFKLLWIFPLLTCVAYIIERKRMELLGFIFLLGGAYAQLLIAGDTSRMFTLGFMVMPISLLFLWQENRFQIRSWIGWVFLANLAIPTLYTASNKIEIWQPLWRYVVIAATR